MPRRLAALTRWLAALTVLVSVGVFLVRGVAAARATAMPPGVAVTTGCEHESFFGLWRALHHQPVFVDPARVPFAAAYFNWLFYAGYAVPVGWAVSWRSDAVIPLAGRMVTAVGAITGAGLLFWLIRRHAAAPPGLAAAVASLVFMGPLTGWWALSVRPDVWALAAETAALGALLSWYRARPLQAALAAAALAYVAWALKQTSLLGLGAALLFLLARRQWRTAGVLAATSAALWLATFALLGPDYRTALLQAAASGVFEFRSGWRNFVDMLPKTAPLWVLGAAALAGDRPGVARRPDDRRLLGLLGLAASLPLAFVASCKPGAYSNYFFTPILLLALVAAGATAAGRARLFVPAGLGLAVAMQLLVASGKVGRLDLMPQAREAAHRWAVWCRQPEPRYAAMASLNQPWLNPASPPLVLAYNYWSDRRTGRRFEAGGVGGLIAAGYFQTLLLPAETDREYDGGSLRWYERGETVDGMAVFHRCAAISR